MFYGGVGIMGVGILVLVGIYGFGILVLVGVVVVVVGRFGYLVFGFVLMVWWDSGCLSFWDVYGMGVLSVIWRIGLFLNCWVWDNVL